MAHRLLFANLRQRRLFPRRERVYRERIAYLAQVDGFTDAELRARFRFGRQSITFITDLIREDITRPTNRSQAVSAELQVLVALRYYASGSFMGVIGDTFGLHTSIVSRIIRSVSVALCDKIPQFVKFPTNGAAIKAGFYEMAGFPNVTGCIDGTQIRIIAPSNDENDFVNRKGFHSINVQAICDHEGRSTFKCNVVMSNYYYFYPDLKS